MEFCDRICLTSKKFINFSNTIAFRGLTNTLMTAQAQYNRNAQIDLDWFTTELLKYIGLYTVVAAISLISGYFAVGF